LQEADHHSVVRDLFSLLQKVLWFANSNLRSYSQVIHQENALAGRGSGTNRLIGKIATPAPESVAALKSSLRDPDERVRKSAYDALQKIDPRSVSDLRPAPAK